MKVNVSSLPKIHLGNRNKGQEVAIEKLQDSGVGIGSYGMKPGDVVQFPESAEDTKVYQSELNGGAKASYISVNRNGKADWFSMSTIRRRGANGTIPCAIVEEMGKFATDKDRLEVLFGKTIRCTGTTELEVNDYTPEGNLSGKTSKRQFPVIEYVS